MFDFCILQTNTEGPDEATPTKPPQNDKPSKGSEPSHPGGTHQQVQAVMKKFPTLRPRGSIPESHLSVHGPAHSYTPNDSSGVKVTLPITFSTLPGHQQGSTYMIVSSPMIPTATPTPPAKRAPDPPAMGSAPPTKRKRGRPRKPRPEETPVQNPRLNQNARINPSPSLDSNPGALSVIQKALPSSPAPPVVPEVLLKCAPESETRPVLLLHEPTRAMVIQRTPVCRDNGNIRSVPTNPGVASHLPPPTVNEDRGEVEITLTPVDPASIASECVTVATEPSQAPEAP